MARVTGKRREGAYKTGLDPDIETQSEDRAAFRELIAQYYQRFHPNGPAEHYLLDDLIYCDWSIRRLQRLQAEAGDQGLEWYSLLASKAAAYESALKTLRDYQANPIPGSALSTDTLKVTIH